MKPDKIGFFIRQLLALFGFLQRSVGDADFADVVN
jgi:hypothetical protein